MEPSEGRQRPRVLPKRFERFRRKSRLLRLSLIKLPNDSASDDGKAFGIKKALVAWTMARNTAVDPERGEWIKYKLFMARANVEKKRMNLSQGRDPVRLLFFGDSIATGQGVPILRSWPLLVGQALQNDGDRVFVSAVNGETTRDALYRLEKNVLPMCAELNTFYLQYGINDANFWQSSAGFPRVSPDAFQANLSEIIERVLATGLSRIIIGTNHPVNKAIPEEAKLRYGYSDLGESVAEYNDLIKKVSAKWDIVELFDLAGHFQDHTHLLSDGVHLSEKGHRTYSKFFLSRLISRG